MNVKSKAVILVALLLLALGLSATAALADGGIIRVHKFHDINENGVQDPGEEDVEGWLMRLYAFVEGQGWTIVAEGTTDSGGWVVFSGLTLNQYKVWEEQRDCWSITTTYDAIWDGGYYVMSKYVPTYPDQTVEFGNVDICTPPPPPPPPPGGEGCTPGYWKQRQHFDSWTNPPYDPHASYFDDVFGVGPHKSLLGALKTGGGGEKALGRHATAALLNAASAGVGYAYTEAEVIAMVQGAYASGDFEGVKNLFEIENEAGCPLN
jgi:hypothetical protein